MSSRDDSSCAPSSSGGVGWNWGEVGTMTIGKRVVWKLGREVNLKQTH